MSLDQRSVSGRFTARALALALVLALACSLDGGKHLTGGVGPGRGGESVANRSLTLANPLGIMERLLDEGYQPGHVERIEEGRQIGTDFGNARGI